MSEAIGGNGKTFKMVPIIGTAAGRPLRKLEHVKAGLRKVFLRLDGSRNFVLSVPDGWYRMSCVFRSNPAGSGVPRSVQIGRISDRQDKVMKVEIEYCGQ